MISIRPLKSIPAADLPRLISGYTSDAKYAAAAVESPGRFTLTLERIPLPAPYVKRFDLPDADALTQYRRAAASGFSFGAFEAKTCVGLALAEPRAWNRSLWVWEFHVAEGYRGRGIGRRLMEALAERGQAAGLRTIVCETQNTNAPAIAFYLRMGFHFEGVDLSLYSNEDTPDGEVAVIMKRRLGAGVPTRLQP